MSKTDFVWRVTVEGERGFLTSDCSLPGLNCERCSIWSALRLVALPIENSDRISKLLSGSLAPILRPEFMSFLNRIREQGIICPISTNGPLDGFLPGDSFSPFTWEERPRVVSELEPFFGLGNLAFIVRGDRLMNRLIDLNVRLQGVWITPIRDMAETWGFLIDDHRERLANDGLNREICPLCGRLDNAKSPEQKRSVGILRSSMLKTKTLPRELVPDRDIFVTDYTHSWFVKHSVLDVLRDELSSNKSVTLEQWSIAHEK